MFYLPDKITILKIRLGQVIEFVRPFVRKDGEAKITKYSYTFPTKKKRICNITFASYVWNTPVFQPNGPTLHKFQNTSNGVFVSIGLFVIACRKLRKINICRIKTC